MKRLYIKYTVYILLALFIFTFYPVSYKMSEEIIEVTLTGKERITTGSGGNIESKFIIYTESEVFENTDSWLYLKFDSADYQNKFIIGKSYKVKVAGWRVSFLSMYRNIIDIKH